MSDTTIGLLVGVLVVLATRAIDWWFPKGWHFKGIRRYGVPDGEDGDKNDNNDKEGTPNEQPRDPGADHRGQPPQ